MIITTKISEFLPNRIGDSVMDGQTDTDGHNYNIPTFFLAHLEHSSGEVLASCGVRQSVCKHSDLLLRNYTHYFDET